MTSLKLILLFSLLFVPGAFAREDSLLARVTVYWASGGSGSDRDTRHHRCATGGRLRSGHCAVDPRHIPYGSRVVLPSGEALAAVDTGTAVRTRKAARKSGHNVAERSALVVDRFFETKGQALAWAARHPLFMPIKVLRPVASAMSRPVAKGKSSFPRASVQSNHSVASSMPPVPPKQARPGVPWMGAPH